MTQPSTLVQGVTHILKPYQAEIERHLNDAIPLIGPPSQVRDACAYSLLNGGKRFRPALVLMIAKALGNPGWKASYSALAIEFFHTASLIADDLPCMDNDDLRRDKPTTHRQFSESTALLATYALIAAGYDFIRLNVEAIRNIAGSLADRIGIMASENASYNTGLYGATGGQYLDINPPDASLKTIQEIIAKKTTAFFEIAFVFGWIFGGGALEQLEAVKKASHHFGNAFQIADDIEDVDQDRRSNKFVNLALATSVEEAKKAVVHELQACKELLKQLKFKSDELNALGALLIKP